MKVWLFIRGKFSIIATHHVLYLVVQAAPVEWAEDEFLQMVLVQVVDMVGKVVMDTIMAPSLMAVLRMVIPISLVNLAVVVEMVVLLAKQQVVGLLIIEVISG
ncbi:uncharacterized protein LOC127151260 [Cucumis melo]|uniref:Uncharacterized protein LOC127151260 n=1 Tax=Cucumis melo TaxID=3656 RepID=A0ABM3L9G5_CUCME|nr:uncharacterized protein LOC127151260 [Cucumis melo]